MNTTNEPRRAAPNGAPSPTRDAAGRRTGEPQLPVRTADIEPYTGLRYLSKLFRLIAIMLVLMLVAEVVTGIARQGADSIPTLVSEVSRLVVLAGLLWGVGDMAVLLVDVGHDVRAVRILLGRQTAHLVHHAQEHVIVPTPAAHAEGAMVPATPDVPPGAAPRNDRRA